MNTQLSAAEAKVCAMHEQMSIHEIAQRLGVQSNTVSVHLLNAKRREIGQLPPAPNSRGKKRTRDAGWHDRQVAYLLTLTDEHANRYLNGIQLVWGLEVRNEVEADMARKLPCRV